MNSNSKFRNCIYSHQSPSIAIKKIHAHVANIYFSIWTYSQLKGWDYQKCFYFYLDIFTSIKFLRFITFSSLKSRDFNLLKNSSVKFDSAGINQSEKLILVTCLIWLVKFQCRVKFYSKIFLKNLFQEYSLFSQI